MCPVESVFEMFSGSAGALVKLLRLNRLQFDVCGIRVKPPAC